MVSNCPLLTIIGPSLVRRDLVNLEFAFIPKLYLLYGFLDSPFFLRQVSIEISLGTASQYTEMCCTKISFGDRYLNIFTF